MIRSLHCLVWFVGWIALSNVPLAADDGEQDLVQQLQDASNDAAEQTFLLRYKFESNEVIKWRVVHLATTDTRIQGTTQTAKTRSTSTKVWKVSEVDAQGNAKFVHLVEDVEMWQKTSERPEVKYNSQTDQTPPPEYAQAAKTVGVPLSQVTLTPTGRIVRRDKEAHQLNMGLGPITIPFPEQPIKVGGHWYVPNEVRVRLQDGRVKRVKTRQKFTLQNVAAGLATLKVETQVLTPVNDPRIESQLVQEVIDGTVKFDMTAGRILSRQIDWDETVVQFSGADSMMKYRARFTETLMPQKRTASAAAKNTTTKQ